ncbi:hypothetical protein E4U59_001302 [Claviceps monticola]|nr:hypothetical protein E4U59_001302 [Claviceps monticola]
MAVPVHTPISRDAQVSYTAYSRPLSKAKPPHDGFRGNVLSNVKSTVACTTSHNLWRGDKISGSRPVHRSRYLLPRVRSLQPRSAAMDGFEASELTKHQASSIKHQASSIEH